MAAAYRLVTRRDPEAPLLVVFHEDGGDAKPLATCGRRLWPGAPVTAIRGGWRQGAGWRHLSEPAQGTAVLSLEEAAIDGIAAVVSHAARREMPLVEAIGVGRCGGADAVLGLLCRHPAVFAGAILCRPARRWSPESLADIQQGNGVEVLILAEPANLVQAMTAKLMASLAGHHAEVRMATEVEEPEICHAWLREELRGESGDGE